MSDIESSSIVGSRKQYRGDVLIIQYSSLADLSLDGATVEAAR